MDLQFKYNPLKPNIPQRATAVPLSNNVNTTNGLNTTAPAKAPRNYGYRGPFRPRHPQPQDYSRRRSQQFLNQQYAYDKKTNSDTKPYNMIFHNTIISLKSNILHFKSSGYSTVRKEKEDSLNVLDKLLVMAREYEQINLYYFSTLGANKSRHHLTSGLDTSMRNQKEKYWSQPFTEEYYEMDYAIAETINGKIREWYRELAPLFDLYPEMQRMQRSYQYRQGTPLRRQTEYKLRRTLSQNKQLINNMQMIREEMKRFDDYLKEIYRFYMRCMDEYKALKKQTQLFAIGARAPESVRLNYIALDVDHRYLLQRQQIVKKQLHDIGKLEYRIHHLLPKELYQDVMKKIHKDQKHLLDHTVATDLIAESGRRHLVRRAQDQANRDLGLLQQRQKAVLAKEKQLAQRQHIVNQKLKQIKKTTTEMKAKGHY